MTYSFFIAGSDVSVTFDVVNPGQTAQLFIYDEKEELVTPPIQIDNIQPNFTYVNHVVSGSLNELTDDTIGLRILKLELTEDGKPSTKEYTYGIKSSQLLAIGLNSFATMSQLEITRMQMGEDLPHFDTSEKNRVVAALETAYRRICRLRFKYMNEDCRGSTIIEEMQFKTKEDITAFPKNFKKALMRAMILEAEEILSGDTVRKKRQRSILSETIGESSMMFRSGAPLETALCTEAMRELAPYTYRNVKIGRG